jgi:hypothetical protein
MVQAAWPDFSCWQTICLPFNKKSCPTTVPSRILRQKKRSPRWALACQLAHRFFWIKILRYRAAFCVSWTYPNLELLAFLAFLAFRQINNLRVFNLGGGFDSPRWHHKIDAHTTGIPCHGSLHSGCSAPSRAGPKQSSGCTRHSQRSDWPSYGSRLCRPIL